jgi:hypothetical protein
MNIYQCFCVSLKCNSLNIDQNKKCFKRNLMKKLNAYLSINTLFSLVLQSSRRYEYISELPHFTIITVLIKPEDYRWIVNVFRSSVHLFPFIGMENQGHTIFWSQRVISQPQATKIENRIFWERSHRCHHHFICSVPAKAKWMTKNTIHLSQQVSKYVIKYSPTILHASVFKVRKVRPNGMWRTM